VELLWLLDVRRVHRQLPRGRATELPSRGGRLDTEEGGGGQSGQPEVVADLVGDFPALQDGTQIFCPENGLELPFSPLPVIGHQNLLMQKTYM